MVKAITARRAQPAWGASVAIEDRFRPLVAELEKLAEVRPDAYRRRVMWRAWLGYGYIAMVLIALLAAIAVMAAVILMGGHSILLLKPALIIVLVIAAILRALWVKAAPPKGITVTRAEAPGLFAMLDEVRARVGGPKADTVLVAPEFNAAIVQRPRLGVFGWHRNYVVIGLPLLRALSRDEVMAVIAHEYGHLSGGHGKSGQWIYRVRMTWLQLSQSLGGTLAGRIFQRFFNWYGPWFNAYSFVLARSNEYEADRASAAVAGAGGAARALARVAAELHRYDAFWHDLWGESGLERESVSPHTLMGGHFVKPMAGSDVREALNAALAEATDIHDTHPSLRDRLAALGEVLPELEPVGQSGAEALLGAGLTQTLAQKLDADWWDRAARNWQARQAQLKATREAMARLEGRGDLSEEESWQYQVLLEQAGRDAEALSLAVRRLGEQPASRDARVAAGRLQLQAGHVIGLDLLRPILDEARPSRSQGAALRAAIDYLARRDPENVLRADLAHRLEAVTSWHQSVEAELNRLDETAVIEPADLPEAPLAALRERAQAVPGLKPLWLAKRTLRADDSVVQYVVLYAVDGARATSALARAFPQEALAILTACGNAMVVDLSPRTTWLKRRLDKLPGAKLIGK